MTDTADTPEVEYDLPDLTTESDDWLTALADAVDAERSARRTRANIPGLVRSLATQYEQGGGDKADLVEAVTNPGTSDAADEG